MRPVASCRWLRGARRRAATRAAAGFGDRTRRGPDGYTAYVACSPKKSRQPSHECKVSQNKAAFFVSNKHDATYKVCVKFPGKKKRLCASAQDAPKGAKQKRHHHDRADRQAQGGVVRRRREGRVLEVRRRPVPGDRRVTSPRERLRGPPTTPSFELGPDHVDLQKWVHAFAADVSGRPPPSGTRGGVPLAGARGGRQDRPLLPGLLRHPELRRDRARHPDHHGGAVLGRRRHRAGDRRDHPGRRRGSRQRHRRAGRASGRRRCSARPGDLKLAAFCSSEPDAGSDVGAMRTRATYDEATDEWVINGTKTWATNGGIADVHVVTAVVDPDLRARGQASFVVPPGTKGLSQGQKFAKHGIRASHTAEVVLDQVRVPGRCLLGGKEKLDARLARAREGDAERRRQRVDGHLRAHPARRWARRRSASRGRRTRWRWTTRRPASSSASRSSRTRPSRSRSRT